MIFIYESIIGDPIWGGGHKRDQPFPVGLGLVGLGGFGPPPGNLINRAPVLHHPIDG